MIQLAHLVHSSDYKTAVQLGEHCVVFVCRHLSKVCLVTVQAFVGTFVYNVLQFASSEQSSDVSVSAGMNTGI